MTDTAKNVIPVSLPIFGVLVCLLWFGKIEPFQFTFLFAVSLLLFFLLPVRDRLKELDIKNIMRATMDMEKVKEGIYAEAKTMKELAIVLGQLTASYVTRVGRWGEGFGPEEMLQEKDRIKSILEKAGATKNTIESITLQIDDTVLFDLKSVIVCKVRDRILKSNPTEEATICGKAVKIVNGHHTFASLQIVCEDVRQEVDEILKDYNLNNSRGRLTQCLENKGVPEAIITEIVPLIDRLDRFIKEKTL